MIHKIIIALALSFFYMASPAQAKEVGCKSTTWRIVNDDKVCIEAFKDPDIDGIVCHVSYAKTGGVSGAIGFAENPSRFANSCRQIGPIISKNPIPIKDEKIFSKSMSFLFKDLHTTRFIDEENKTIIYLVTSDKIIDGSPYNSISTVPMMPWGDKEPNLSIKK